MPPVKRRIRSAAALALALGLLAGCAPRTVTRVTGSNDQVKLVYNRVTVLGTDTGVVQCDRAEDGNLGNCRDLAIEFHKPASD